jgi:hypothetical protein
MQNQLLTTNRKALTINLDPAKYGTFAEIGAGQETARYFFQAGGSAGTIAKSISAYDMKFSDEIYGKSGRYVSEERLIRMLDYEFCLINERLAETRGATSTFFVFSNTVAAKSYRGTHDCHGWLGIRFQREPGSDPSDIIIHVRMLDKENVQQQQALGIIGVNLIYAAFYLQENTTGLVRSLLDNLTAARIEVDMIRFGGLGFEAVDNRLMSLELVRQGLTQAVMFSPGADVIQPSEILYKKAVLVERGSFRPVTSVNVDMLTAGMEEFSSEPEVQGEEVVVIMEMTMNNLLTQEGEVDAADFLARVDILCRLGYNVMISNYPEYYRLATYFRRYTRAMVGVVLGVNNLVEIFNEKYYENLDGGILESFGRLFRNTVKLYVYPMRRDALEHAITLDAAMGEKRNPAPQNLEAHELVTADNIQMFPHLRHLYAHLRDNHYITPIRQHNRQVLQMFPRDILRRIQSGKGGWEEMVPSEVADLVKERKLFGYRE